MNENDDLPLCSNCDGSGEGYYDGSRCTKCHGSGVEQESDASIAEDREEHAERRREQKKEDDWWEQQKGES